MEASNPFNQSISESSQHQKLGEPGEEKKRRLPGAGPVVARPMTKG